MNPHIRAWIRETDDRQYDPWGSMMAQGFAIAEVLSAPDCDGTVPAEMDYRHGAYHPLTLVEFIDSDPEDGSGGTEWYNEAQYARMLEAREITPADLEHAGRVIARWFDLPAVQARSY